MAGADPRLGKVQLEIMRVLWRRGRATAREITDDLTRSSAIAHSTVQTFPGLGHVPQEEDPVSTVQAVHTFLHSP